MKVRIEADGGSRGNPGPAGYGAVVFDAETGEVLAERAESIGIATNNVAEYGGLIAGLQAALDLGADSAEVRMDSKLVVEQMMGRWQVKHPGLRPLASQAHQLAGRFTHITYSWIPRNRNTHADRLANEAMDAAAANPTAPTRPKAPEQQALPVTPDRRPAQGQAKATRPPAGGQAEPADPAASGQLGLGLAGATPDQPRSATDPQHRPAATAEPRRPADPHPQADLAHRTSPTSWTGARGEPTRLLLLRHGQTPMSAERRYSGRGDVDLTELGRAQAEAAARRLAKVDGVDATTPVVASPLTRTLSTARSVVTNIGGEVITHPGLIETDFGAWEGLTFTEAAQRDPELHARWLADPSVPAPDGESFDAVHRRVAQARDEVLTRFAGRTVIVVSHVTPIKALLRMALDAGPSLLFRLHLDLASLSIAEFYPDGNASVRLVNDISHLG